MTDISDQARREITGWMEQLRPVLSEYAQSHVIAQAPTSIGVTPLSEAPCQNRRRDSGQGSGAPPLRERAPDW